MNRKVVRAVLHDVLHVPAFGQFGKTLSNYDPQCRFKDIEMEWEPGSGLIWRYKGKWGLIPAASVFQAEFAPEATAPAPALMKQSFAV